jgi:hypothetical protein
MRISFATQAYQSDSLPVSAQRCVNAYLEVQPQDAKYGAAVFGCPGIETFANVGSGPIRGLFEMGGVAYVVSRNELYSLSSGGLATLLGTGITGLNRVSIAGNGIEVIIVNGSLGFVYNTSTTAFVQISDGDFNVANTVTFIDSYFVLDEAGTNKFFLSDLLAGTSYDALLFASAESHHDHVVACWNNNGVLLVFGEETIESWDHTGAFAFPFQRYKGGTIDRGLAAAQAITAEDQGIFFLGDNRIFYRLQGSQPVRLSNHAIEKEWEGYSTITDAFCISMTFGGHTWIYITFPTANTTFCYDIATNRWHERESYDSQAGRTRWRANCVAEAYGRTLIGDAQSNKVGRLSGSIYTEFGTTIIKTLVSPPIHGDGKRCFMPMFELDMDAGVGLADGQGEDPQAMLDWSDDGGRTYGAPQLWRSMGKIGEYQRRLQWDRLGSFYNRHLRLRIADPVKRVVIAARAPGLSVEA